VTEPNICFAPASAEAPGPHVYLECYTGLAADEAPTGSSECERVCRPSSRHPDHRFKVGHFQPVGLDYAIDTGWLLLRTEAGIPLYRPNWTEIRMRCFAATTEILAQFNRPGIAAAQAGRVYLHIDVHWYFQALSIINETCEWVLGQVPHVDQYYLRWQ